MLTGRDGSTEGLPGVDLGKGSIWGSGGSWGSSGQDRHGGREGGEGLEVEHLDDFVG